MSEECNHLVGYLEASFDEGDMLLPLSLVDGDEELRPPYFKFCPLCGKDIRAITITLMEEHKCNSDGPLQWYTIGNKGMKTPTCSICGEHSASDVEELVNL